MPAVSIAPYFPFARCKVVGHNVHLETQVPGSQVYLEPDRRCRPICPDCRRPGRVHAKGLQRWVRDLNLGPCETLLQIEYRRVFCDACRRARVEHFDFVERGQRITARLARYLYGLCCSGLTVQAVARRTGLDPKTVRAVEKRFLQEEFGTGNYDNLRILAIDEIAIQKGQSNYMTVVLDYETGRVVWMGEGRNKETLDRFFAELSEAQRTGIEAVAIDMWEPYLNRIRHHLPQAQVVFDLFHLVKAYGAVIDEIRREEVRQAVGPDRTYIKGCRYLLLKNKQNLSSAQRSRLKELLAVNQRLSEVYALKDQLKMIYEYRRRWAAKRSLEQWCAMSAEIDHPAMRRFIRRLRQFEEGILNHCDHAIGTSPLEGVNNKIKVIKRQAYGFHDRDYFALKVKQACPGKETTTESG